MNLYPDGPDGEDNFPEFFQKSLQSGNNAKIGQKTRNL